MVQFTLTPESRIQTGSHEQPTVKHIAVGCSEQVIPAHGSLGQTPVQERLVMLKVVTFGVPQSKMSPVSLRNTASSLPQRETTAHVASGKFGQVAGLQGLAARKGSMILSHSTPPKPPQHLTVGRLTSSMLPSGFLMDSSRIMPFLQLFLGLSSSSTTVTSVGKFGACRELRF